jgi:2-keto-4-pentenoate hydratase/2-oxohepta-3-ene-1,7-dioic acid hydratase in catechol pathway
MKIIRYQNSNNETGLAWQDDNGNAFILKGDIYGQLEATNTPVEINKLLAPIVPSVILCIGLNYKAHAEEGGMTPPELPILFVKGANTLQNPNGSIEIPKFLESNEVDYECELAVVIGKPCKNVSTEEAMDYVLGYTCANDVSARDWQLKRGGGQWCRGKFFDTFAPLGPCLVTADEITSPNTLRIQTHLNGETVQDSNTSDMIFNVAEIISFLSGSTTLLPGTVILTGTPQGVGMSANPQRYLKAGDSVTIEIDQIGKLTNPVKNEPIA